MGYNGGINGGVGTGHMRSFGRGRNDDVVVGACGDEIRSQTLDWGPIGKL